MTDTTNIDLTFLSKQVETVLSVQREMQREHADFRTLLLGLVDQNRRLERKLAEVVPDMELVIKSEIMGRFARYDS